MTDANISGTALPAFDRIRPGDVEATIRELLQRSRGEVATLESQPHPTFDNTVLPLEQLSHRLSRTWSPISHLNGVLNSDELRASYNACLPLLSNYWTDLAQSEPLYRAYSAIAANESDRLDPAQRRVLERALEDFRLAGVGLPRERKDRYKTVVQELGALSPQYFSVTYGAGGSTRDKTLGAVMDIAAAGFEAAPHLSCVGSTRENIAEILATYREQNIHRVVALLDQGYHAGVGGHQVRLEEGHHLHRGLHVGVEGHQVRVRVALLLAGDLVLRGLVDQVGGAGRHFLWAVLGLGDQGDVGATARGKSSALYAPPAADGP